MRRRHFAKYKGEEVIILDYLIKGCWCNICDFNKLAKKDGTFIYNAAWHKGHESYYLIKILKNMNFWNNFWNYLANSAMLRVTLNDLQDMCPEQKAFFKGYPTVAKWLHSNFNHINLINGEVIFDSAASELDYLQQTEQPIEVLKDVCY